MRLPPPPATLLIDASLFLDFDGTLVELAPMPDAVEVGAELLDRLSVVQDKLGGRVALLSGRSAEDVRRRLGTLELPIGGSHGLELVMPGQTCEEPVRPYGLDQAITTLKHLESQYPGVHIEEKPAGVAVHYRLAPMAEALCRDAAERAATAIGMALQHGKMVVELKPKGADKGSALRSFMAAPPFAGTKPIFIGDDLTDEHGFVMARQLGGAGVLVGPERATAASYRLADVESVRRWLQEASVALP